MKKRSLLRFTSLSLIMTMCLSSLIGCGDQSSSPADSTVQESTEEAVSGQEEGGDDAREADASETEGMPDDLYIIDMLGVVDSDYMSTDTTIGKVVAEKTGVAFNYIAYPGDLQEKQAMMLAGGDYGELQYMQHNDIVKKYIEAGALINLDDYKDLMPHFYERFKEQIPYWRALAPDGGLYKWEMGQPRDDSCPAATWGIDVRSDILEYYGWPELVTASDWIAFLEKAIQDFPTTPDGQETIGLTLPMGEAWGAQGVVPIASEYGDTYANAGNDYYIYNVKTHQFEDYLLCEEAKESIRFFNTLYQKGLFDEECFTDTGDTTAQKMSSGRAICDFYCDFYNSTAYVELSKAGHPEMAYVELPFQLDSQKGQKYVTRKVVTDPFDSYGITKNCKDPERLCKLIDWSCTDEGQLLLQSGIENVHYTVEDGKRVPTELRIQCTKDSDLANQEGLLDNIRGLPYIFTRAEDGQPFNLTYEQEYQDTHNLNDREKEAYAALGWRNSQQWWQDNTERVDCGFINSCALDTTSDLGKVGQKMIDVRLKYTGALIMAEDFDAVWNEMLAEYDKLDHQAVIDAMNEKQAELDAQLKQ